MGSRKSLPVLFIFLGVLLLTSQLSATETRVGSMGGVGLYMHDDSNIFLFPGAIYTYAGQVIGELRVKNNDNSYSVGIHYPFGDYYVLGVYLNRPVNMSIPGGIVDDVTLDNTTDIFYGVQMTNFDLGFNLSIGLDGSTTGPDTAETEQTARFIGLGAGLSHETMDLGVRFEMPNAETESPGIDTKYSGFGFGLAGRTFIGEETQWVPAGVLYYSSTSGEIDTFETDYGIMNIGLGIGFNHELNEQNLLVFGLEAFGMSRNKVEVSGGDDTTFTVTTLPGLYMGLESEIRPWLIGRLGAAQVYQNATTSIEPPDGPEVESSSRSSQFDLSFGLGIQFGDFLLDAAINEGLFFDGPNFISGGENPMATRLSLTYEF